MKKFTRTEKMAIIAMILNIAVFSSCFFLFRDIQKRNSAISTILNDLGHESEKQSRYLSLKDTIEETKGDRSTIDSFFISSDGAVSFIELVEDQGRLSGATTTIFSVHTE